MIERTYKNNGIEFRVFEDDIDAIGSKGEKYGMTFDRKGVEVSGRCSCPGFQHRGACKHVAAALPIIRQMRPEWAQ